MRIFAKDDLWTETLLPTMEMVYEKKWSTSNSVITDSYIIVEVGLSEHKQAIMIDKVSGKLTEIN